MNIIDSSLDGFSVAYYLVGNVMWRCGRKLVVVGIVIIVVVALISDGAMWKINNLQTFIFRRNSLDLYLIIGNWFLSLYVV
jgi:hypothetical protein